MQKSEKTALRLATFNIQNRLGESKSIRERRLERIASLLKSVDADLVCLQEVLISDYEFLTHQLEVEQSTYMPRDDGQHLGEGNPILCLGKGWRIQQAHHFWLSDTPEKPSRSWKAKHNRVASVAELQGRNFRPAIWLANLHLDHASRLARRESLGLVRRQLDHMRESKEEPMLVCGDFNMRPAGLEATGFVGNRPEMSGGYTFKDAAKDYERKAAIATYTGWGPFSLLAARLDYCLHSPALHCVAYEVYDPVHEKEWLSDHRMVVADFQLGLPGDTA